MFQILVITPEKEKQNVGVLGVTTTCHVVKRMDYQGVVLLNIKAR
jgi:hypothetical protein